MNIDRDPLNTLKSNISDYIQAQLSEHFTHFKHS